MKIQLQSSLKSTNAPTCMPLFAATAIGAFFKSTSDEYQPTPSRPLITSVCTVSQIDFFMSR